MIPRVDNTEESRKRGHSVTRTIRLDEDLDSQLTTKSERERESVNLLINRALRGYLEWNQHAKMFGFTTVSLKLVEKMMDSLSPEEAQELGRWSGTNTLAEMTSMIFGTVRFTSMIATLTLMAKYSGSFVLEHTYEQSKHTLILYHRGGIKWSQFYEQFLR